ncbi:hypothetical protein [Aestuariivita sp.]|uniref:hypothetical protein n=1 Tax=Aestuariivita sp. TaxID=1872407 RepID=UPI0021744A6C|nr:hypothetical protein [Aestuariivita sp.]MCE8005991.1 hypothetical protein [Aestuariivita sp.]
MAKSFLNATMKAIKAAERERVRQAKAALRDEKAAIRERERAAKAHEASLRRMAIADERERKAHEKALKAAHVDTQMAKVASLNAQIEDTFEEIDGLLEATLEVDDYVDLELLRLSEKTTPFDMPELEVPSNEPKKPRLPDKPAYVEPPKPRGFFGKKKKLIAAVGEAKKEHELAIKEWEHMIAANQSKYETQFAAFEVAEANRLEQLKKEKERFRLAIEEHNQKIDQFISNLAYGDVEAVQEYIAMVVENSSYPDHFSVSHIFTFVAETAELQMKVSIPAPADFPAIKAYKYVKTSDEIRELPLSKTEFKDRYGRALYQVAIRSLHEVFEADRRGLIRTIALEVGSDENDPATGKSGFLPFVGVSAERKSFMEFDLAGVVPLATLKHLGAAISKDPVNLVAVDVLGVRKS